MAEDRPIIGAALTARTLELHRDWILERQRDLEIQDFHRAAVLDSDWSPITDRLRTLLDGYSGRLGLHGPFWGFQIDSEDPLIRAVVTKRLMQGLDVCAALGATQMVVHSPFTVFHHYNLDNEPSGESSAREQHAACVHATLDPVVARAADQGVELVLENIADLDPNDRVTLARSFGSRAVRVSVDTGHAHFANGRHDAPPVDYFIRAAGEMLAHVHVQDVDGYADRHWLPGEGTIAWPAVFRAIGRLAVRPRLIIEVRDQANLRRGAAHLEALGLVA